MTKTNICIGRYYTKVSRLNFSTENIEEKIKIYNHALLGYTENSLINKKYEDVLYLLFYKHLPNKEEKQEMLSIINSAYKINYTYQFNLIKNNIFYFKDNPLNLVEIVLLSLNCLKENKDINYTSLFVQCLIVSLNCFNAYLERDFCLPSSELSIIENWLNIIGKDYKNKELVSNFSKMLIAWMECYLPSSSIAGMLSISARTDFISAVVSGFINCTGKKHTSARIECAKFLLDLKNNIEKSKINEDDIDAVKKIIKIKIQNILDNHELIYGFGHYVFKGLDEDGYDPRIRIVKNAINKIFPNSFYLKITELIVEMFKNGSFTKDGKEFKLPPNSDIFWTSFLLDFFKDYKFIPIELISLFTILTRLSGIIAHCDEQYSETDPIRVYEE